MKRPTMFKLLTHRQFDFTTRYYDAEREEREARHKALYEKYEKEEKEKTVKNIQDSIDFSSVRNRRTERKPVIIRALLIAGMFALLYFVLK
ncbi:hypothetical protein MY04_3479 [Flammeovirga sp. MY04]|uniref:hypothetical protein n=1 Tax=Flammeovirga sp. MY04 TaxID=1191459 RepID=UPI0013053A4A|nr:hypothetical protein [Flammeovirga sp. MY04]ANQ50832.2 hypothetical protein MY04_3479 [Flammeovirga sp. MY04]